MGRLIGFGKIPKGKITTKETIKQKMSRALEQGLIEFSSPARKRMYEMSLHSIDIEHVVRGSEITEFVRAESGSHIDAQWVVKIKGTTIDGQEIASVIQVNDSVIIVSSIG